MAFAAPPDGRAGCATLARGAETDGMQTLGWTLQVLALVLVGTALLVGLFYDQVRTELGMLAVGGGLFLTGRWIGDR